MQQRKVSTISPREAQARINGGAALVDVREYPEWAACQISQATLIPLGDIKRDPQCAAVGDEVLLLCGSGRRASEAARCLAEAGLANARVIEGGIKAWKAAGLPTQKGEGGPISMERQVRIGAGALVLLGLLAPKLRVISYLVPCGLIFAGITNTCGMAKVLSRMPWNQPQGNSNNECRERKLPDEAQA